MSTEREEPECTCGVNRSMPTENPASSCPIHGAPGRRTDRDLYTNTVEDAAAYERYHSY